MRRDVVCANFWTDTASLEPISWLNFIATSTLPTSLTNKPNFASRNGWRTSNSGWSKVEAKRFSSMH